MTYLLTYLDLLSNLISYWSWFDSWFCQPPWWVIGPSTCFWSTCLGCLSLFSDDNSSTSWLLKNPPWLVFNAWQGIHFNHLNSSWILLISLTLHEYYFSYILDAMFFAKLVKVDQWYPSSMGGRTPQRSMGKLVDKSQEGRRIEEVNG